MNSIELLHHSDAMLFEMNYSLEGKTALVTGASRGIGAAIAIGLDEAGARIILNSRKIQDLEKVAKQLNNDPILIASDLGQIQAVLELAEKALQKVGAVDILVNNAAIAARLWTQDTDASLIDDILAVNVRAPLLLIGALVPKMIQQQKGSIINLSSVSGIVGTPRRAAYAASKGAIDAASRSMAIEFGPFGIRVNSVAPGVVDTQLWAKNKAISSVVEKIEEQTPLRRWALPKDIADVVVFLASDAARFITGETIAVDGGMARTLDLYPGEV